MHYQIRSPRLRDEDHVVSTYLIRFWSTPIALVLVVILVGGYVGLVSTGLTFDKIWELPKLILGLAVLATLLSILGLISNAYQEVSADKRHDEVTSILHKGINDRDIQIEQLSTQVVDLAHKVENSAKRITIL